jgi:hypothetical protein
MIEMATNPRDERIAVTKAAVLSCGGVCKLARKTNSITKSKKAKSAANPCGPHANVRERVGTPLGTEPKFLVRQIDYRNRHPRYDTRNTERNDRCQYDDCQFRGEKRRLGLPAVDEAAPCEVRAENLRNTRCVVGGLYGARYDEHEENRVRQASIGHGSSPRGVPTGGPGTRFALAHCAESAPNLVRTTEPAKHWRNPR